MQKHREAPTAWRQKNTFLRNIPVAFLVYGSRNIRIAACKIALQTMLNIR